MDAWGKAFALSSALFIAMSMTLAASFKTGHAFDILLLDGLNVVLILSVTFYAGIQWWKDSCRA